MLWCGWRSSAGNGEVGEWREGGGVAVDGGGMAVDGRKWRVVGGRWWCLKGIERERGKKNNKTKKKKEEI